MDMKDCKIEDKDYCLEMTKNFGKFFVTKWTDKKNGSVANWSVGHLDDDKPLCFCPSENRANLIGSALHLSEKILKVFDVDTKKIDEDVNKYYHGDKMIEKMRELSESGKSPKEILDYMLEHRNDFLKDKNNNPIPTLDKDNVRKDW